MKKRFSNFFFLTFCVLLIIPLGYAQDIMWEKSFGGRHADYLTDIQPTADYGLILGGSSLSQKSGNKTSVSSGDLDFWIWKMDEKGGAEWQKSFGGTGADMLQSIKTTHDGGFILAGTSNSSKGLDKTQDGHGGNDYWVIKLNAHGEQMWQQTFGGIGQDDLSSLVLTKDGGYVLAGSSNSSPLREDKEQNIKKKKSQGSMDYWIIKLDSDGKELWQQSYGGKYSDQLRSIALTKDGGFIVGGCSNSPASGDKSQDKYGKGNDFWILKLDQSGIIEWQQTIGGNKDDQLQVVHQSRDGNYIVAGNSASQTRTTKKGTDLWVLKLNDRGEIMWEEAYDIGDVDVLTSLIENEDSTMLLGGYSPTTYSGDNGKEGVNDFVALKIAEDGKELWRKSYGSVGQDILQKVVMSRDGGYILAGTSNPEFSGYGRKKKTSVLSGIKVSENEIALAKKAQEELDGAVKGFANDVNGSVKEGIGEVTDQINNTLGSDKDSGFKMGVNGPVGDFLNPTAGSGNESDDAAKALAAKGPKAGTKISRDKNMQLGSSDFWILKIKDNEKKLTEKTKIEAIPNPVVTYTNVIVGFEFDKGTASLYDLAGRQLQSFKIDSRTIPVDLSTYAEGIYIVNIRTNKGEGSVKIIKQISKN
jgi:hypothetical protein